MDYQPLQIPLRLVGALGPNVIVCGAVICRQRRLMTYHRGDPRLPHAQASGQTGGGKGSFLRCVAVHQMHHHHPLIVIEPAGLGENDWMGRAASRVATLPGAAAAYRHVVRELGGRADLMAAEGASHYSEVGLVPWQVIFDEGPSFTSAEGISCPEDAELVDSVITDMTVVARRGRKYGIHQLYVTQRPTIEASFLPGRGGVIQGNTPGRVHFGDRDPNSLRAAFNGSTGVKRSVLMALEASTGPGRVLYTRLNPADAMQVMAGQVWWITPDQAAGFAHRYEGPDPIDFDATVEVFG